MVDKYSRIRGHPLQVGIGCTFGDGVDIDCSGSVIIGDHCYIGSDVRIRGTNFFVGDYSKIHQSCWINAVKDVSLGHLAWIGQNSVIDGTGGLSAGDFFGVGLYSALYSHVRHGDVLEGCQYDHDKQLMIGDDVWFVGSCLVSPIHANSKSMALLGSVVTKDMQYNHVYGGCPAVDLTEKLGPPWHQHTVEEKTERMHGLIEQYCRECHSEVDKDLFVVVTEFPSVLDDRVYYNVRTRQYTKHNFSGEIAFNKWLFGCHAKFLPVVP